MDADAGLLQLQFNEPVLNSTFIATSLSLHSSREAGFNSTLGSFFNLSGASSVTADLRGLLNITLLDVDLNSIKELTTLAINRGTSFLSFQRGFVLDTSLNEAVVRYSDDPLPALGYIKDMTGPELVSFYVNLFNETVTFIFSETIDASSVDVSQFRFQNHPHSASSFYHLTNSKVTTNDSTVLILSLSEEDSNGIKAIENPSH